MAYNFIDQNIVSSCLIQSHTDDSFYNPVVNQHTGFAFDGGYYSLGVLDTTHAKASWYTEFGSNSFRGEQAPFPTYGIALLSPVSLVILDQTTAVQHAEQLPLWMQFVLGDNNALANNFDGSVQGFLPNKVVYADGIISVTYSPDAGNQLYFISNGIVTATSVASNVLTVTTSSGIFMPGQKVTFSGTAEAFLNGAIVTVNNPVVGSTFTANFTNPNYTNASEPAGAVATVLGPILPDSMGKFPVPYPNVPVQSSMVVSIDFTQDSVYLDVSV
jgi:hypothetical protein